MGQFFALNVVALAAGVVDGFETTNKLAGSSNVTAKPGNYSFDSKIVTVGGFVGGSFQDAVLYYPVGTPADEPFRLVAFSHGMGFGGERTQLGIDAEMSEMARHGFASIAPRSCPLVYCSNVYQDQLRAIEWAIESNDPALENVAFDRIGLMGRKWLSDSMGGHATLSSSAKFDEAKHRIVASIAQHPSIHFEADLGVGVRVPIMFHAGTVDVLTPADGVTLEYEKVLQPKVLLNIRGASHFEPNFPPIRWNPSIVQWWGCYLNLDSSACDEIRSVCTTDPVADSFADCRVEL